MSYLNDCLPTHYHCQTTSFSCIDVSQFFPFLSWHRLSSFHCSDHYPILVTDVSLDGVMRRRIGRRSGTHLRLPFPEWVWLGEPRPGILLFGGLVGFLGALLSSEPRVPWWTPECSSTFQDKKRRSRSFHRTGLLSYFVALKFASTRARRSSWHTYVSSLTSRSSTSLVWRRVGKISRLPSKSSAIQLRLERT